MTTKAEIAAWFHRGIDQQDAFMIVWTDRFDNADYPGYYRDKDAAVEALRGDGRNMQKIMECYDLNAPLQPQLAQARAWPCGMPTFAPPESALETDRTPAWELAPGHTVVVDGKEAGTVQTVTKRPYGYSVDLGPKRLYLDRGEYVDTVRSTK